MIIECHSCHARFRLDDSRIKGRGARVKCRRCGDSILVLKESASAPAPPPAGDEGFFDLGSAVRDSVGDRPPPPAAPVGNLIPFPTPPRTAEPTGAPAPVPTLAAAPPDEPATADSVPAPGKDEVDLAFDQFLAGEPKDSLPPTAEMETAGLAPPEPGKPPEDQAHAVPPPELELGAPTLDFTPEETLDLPPAETGEPQHGELEFPEATTGPREEAAFLASGAELLASLEEVRPALRPGAPPRFDDISPAISSSPAEEGDSLRREPEPPPPPLPGLEPPPPAGFALEGNVTPPSAPAMEVPPPPETGPASSPEPTERRISPAPGPPRERSSAGPVAAAVLAILLAAGGYLGFTTSGRKTLEGAAPGVAGLLGGKPAAPKESRYDLRNVIGYYESGGASPRILVIKGQVTNLSGADKSGIRVHAALLDNNDAVLLQQAVYAGNVLSGETIRKADRETLTKALGNRFGEGLANMHVGSGKSIPFMVVFFDAPANFDSYKLEAKDGE